jgi:acetyl esterase/lipase
VCVSSVALLLSSAVCLADDCPPDHKATTDLPEETPDYIYQPPPPNDFNILHRYRFVPPPPYASPYPTVLMLPPDVFTAEYGDRGVPSEQWATYDLQHAGFLVFQVDHRLAPPNTLPGQATDGCAPFQTDDLKRQILAALADEQCNGSIYLVGGSAGGTLVLWCALDPAAGDVSLWNESKRAHIKAVVSLSGPADFCDLDSNPGDIPPEALAKFKNNIDNYVRLPDGTDCTGDPNGNLMHASPKWLVTNGATSSPPPMMLYATDGDIVPNSQATDMLRAMKDQFGLSFPVDAYIMHYDYTDTQHRHAYTYWHSLNNADNSDGRCVSQQVIDFLVAHP